MDTLFLIVSKLGWAVLRPDTWIVAGLAAAMLGALTGRRRLALWLGGPVLAGTLALAVLPLGDLLIAPLERQYPPAPKLSQVDGIIVLGGGEDFGADLRPGVNEAGDRFIAAAMLARDWPDARVVFTGGSGALRHIGAEVRNADVAQALLTGLGIAPDRIVLEGQSRNTAENATLTRAVVEPQPGEVWVLVTSAFHMPRAMGSFDAAGWDGIVPWPVDYRAEGLANGLGWDLTAHLQVLNTAVREYVGLIAYRITGR